MAKIVRNGDSTISGWPSIGTPSYVIATGTSLADGQPIATKANAYIPVHLHYWGFYYWTGGDFNSAVGSSSVFVDGSPVLRPGDIASCMCIISGGSPDVETI
jgi:uncharacterized Zn-binding protein involved in type VI secretion